MMNVRCLLIFLLLVGCSEKDVEKIQKFEGLAQGTTYHISFWMPPEQAFDSQAVEADVLKTFADIDKNLSNYRPDSTIEQFNASPAQQAVEVGHAIVSLLRTAERVSSASQGCYDLTIKPLFDLWGFKADVLSIPDAAKLAEVRQQIGLDKVAIVDDSHLLKKLPQTQIDLSSIAQGYTVGRVSQALEQHGISNYLVEIGGELKTHGHKPDGTAWRIAVEKPLPGEQRLFKVISMPKDAPMAVMTSGTYRHYFDEGGKRYSHILDARSGRPVEHNLVAVTVIHENPTVADAWSTALLCVGPQVGLELANSEQLMAIFVQQDGTELVETRSQPLLQTAILTLH